MGDSLFLDLQFSPVRPDDREMFTRAIRKYPHPLAGYTYASLAAWDPFFHYGWTLCAPETLLITCVMEAEAQRHLLQPVGVLGSEMKDRILAGAARLPYPLKIFGVGEPFLSDNADFAAAFSVREDRALSNYLYSAESLANLRGRKYSKKRNLISQAMGLYEWKVETLTSDRIPGCFSVLESIAAEENPVMEGMLKRELEALGITLRHLNDWEQQGALVTVEQRPVAFSLFEEIGPKTAAIHFERALRSYKGLYQVINQETAKIVASQGYEFINREEDLGNLGLRAAKQSYYPIEIIPAFELTYKR